MKTTKSHARLLFVMLFAILCLTCSANQNIFGNAQWIGGNDDDMGLYSPYLTVFKLSWNVETNKSTSKNAESWLKFGGGDERFASAWRNAWGIENVADSIFVLVEADFQNGELRISRNGMDVSGHESITLDAKNLREKGSHKIELAVAYGTADVLVDGKKVGVVNLNPARGAMNESLTLTGDYVAYPCLGNVTHGSGVKNLELRNYRSPGNLIQISDYKRLDGYEESSVFKNRSCLQLRTQFTDRKPIEKATLFITSRGIYDVYINGKLVNNTSYFDPGFTQYDRTHLYQTYDVSDKIKEGSNCLAVLLAEGWWSGASTYSAQNWNFFGDRQSLLCRLSIQYEDGTVENVVSNPDTWECCSDGSLMCASMFNGAVIDGRRPLFDDASNWHMAVVVPVAGTTVEGEDYSNVDFLPQKDAPVHAIDTLTAISVWEPQPNVYVYDMGQNCAAVPHISLKNQSEGTEINLRYGEMMYNGSVLTENYRAAISQDKYICRGGMEIFSPRQTLHGFRYIEISGIDEPLPLECVKAIALSSIDKVTAHYECSDSIINKLWNNILWSARSNFVSIPTDCPQRNERMGWSGDISVFSRTATYLADVEDFLRRHLRAMCDTQDQDGRFADIAPMRGEGFGGLLWGSAGITVAWECYERWGNLDILREHYAAMAKYIDYVKNECTDEDGLIVQNRQWGDLGDWLSPVYDADDKSLLWECYFIHDLDIMAKAASALGMGEDAEYYSKLRDERKTFFRKTYLADDGTTIGSAFDASKCENPINTQVSYILPIAFDICDAAEQKAMANHLCKLIGKDDYHLMVGFIGVSWIGEALSKIGRSDLIYRILACQEYPSWLYSVRQGATTIWERLNSYVEGEGFPAGNGMNSFNHYSFGSVGAWLIERSLGIRMEGEKLLLQPSPDSTGHLTWASGHFDSRFGRIESKWQRLSNGEIKYCFKIPEGITATVALPNQNPAEFGAGEYEILGSDKICQIEGK